MDKEIKVINNNDKIEIKYPKGYEEFCLAGYNLTLDDIKEIVYDNDGYIEGFIPKNPCKIVSIDIIVDPNESEVIINDR